MMAPHEIIKEVSRVNSACDIDRDRWAIVLSEEELQAMNVYLENLAMRLNDVSIPLECLDEVRILGVRIVKSKGRQLVAVCSK